MEGAAFVVGVAGGTSSGKNTVCKMIQEAMAQHGFDNDVLILKQEYFYRELTVQERADLSLVNFDHPGIFDEDLMVSTVQALKQMKPVALFPYDFGAQCRAATSTTIEPKRIVLFAGILVFWFPRLRDLFDMKLFVDLDSDSRLSRRVLKDLERGRSLDSTLTTYTKFVKPSFEEFVLPTKKYADVVLPRGVDNTVAIGLIVQRLRLVVGDLRGTAQPAEAASPSKPSAPGQRPH